jgi:hypothetical protein
MFSGDSGWAVMVLMAGDEWMKNESSSQEEGQRLVV